MTKNQIKKAAVLNGSIVIADILLLSKGFFNLLSQNNIILWAVGISVIVMSILFFFYGNYTIFLKQQPAKLYKASEFKDYDDYIDALKDGPNQKIFKKEIEEAVKQIERMGKKSEILNVILLQYFEEGEMSYARFQNVIDGTKNIFFGNIKKIINAIAIFDAENYKEAKEAYQNGNRGEENNGRPAEVTDSCRYMERIKTAIQQNAILLKKLDDLTLEISKLDDGKEAFFDELPAIQEINRLIQETKYYQ